MSILIKNGRIITAEQDYFADVFIENEKISLIGSALKIEADTVIDAKNKFVIEKVKLALSKAGNQRTKAAELLGVTPRTLFRYLENMDV